MLEKTLRQKNVSPTLWQYALRRRKQEQTNMDPDISMVLLKKGYYFFNRLVDELSINVLPQGALELTAY